MLDLSKLSKDSLSYIYKLVENGYDFDIFEKENFTEAQLEELIFGLNSGIDITPYLNSCFSIECMRYIREGIIMGIDISLYNKPSFSQGKMKEIRDSIVNKTYIPAFSSDKINEGVIRNCSIMLLEGFDKSLVEFLAENYCVDRINRIKNFNIVYGNLFNELFKKYNLNLKTLNEFLYIAKNNFSMLSEDLFILLKEVEIEDKTKLKKVTKLILNDIPFDKCRDFLYEKISFDELFKREEIDYKDKILEIRLEKILGRDYKDNYEKEYISNILELMKQDINLYEFLNNKYTADQLEEILYTIEDCGKKSISQINNSMTPFEIFKFRNNQLFITNYRKTCQKLSMKKEFQNEILERMTIDFSPKGKWVLTIDNINVLESMNIKDIIEQQKPIISLIKDGLNGEEVLINLQENL